MVARICPSLLLNSQEHSAVLLSHSLFICSQVNGRLSSFRFLSTTKNAAKDIGVNIYFHRSWEDPWR